ncbi:unnamed protein product [Staurois parvus]|uniref:Uncharacterized protein n=1 Tax=Staurois parvus TaxID=386267 RepID=A0ABN9DPX3_9NEOB|nr:unnamed protein product [Staurois parvus]
METTAGSKAAEGSFGVSACTAHESGNSNGTEVTDVGTSTNPEGSDIGALSYNICICKGTKDLGSKEGKELEVAQEVVKGKDIKPRE